MTARIERDSRWSEGSQGQQQVVERVTDKPRSDPSLWGTMPTYMLSTRSTADAILRSPGQEDQNECHVRYGGGTRPVE